MINSMTGYAARTLDIESGSIHIELKSVNSRYLDFYFRIGEELRVVEPALRELIAARVSPELCARDAASATVQLELRVTRTA